MKEEDKSTIGLIRAMAFTLNQFRLYSIKHPIAQESLKTLSVELESYYATHEKLSLGILHHMLVIDGKATGEREPAARDLAKSLERVGIEAMVIEKGVLMTEFSSFLELLAMRGKILQDKGGFKQAFESSNFPSIKLSKGKFQLVEEWQEVAEQGAKVTAEASEPPKPGDNKAAAQAPVASIGDIIKRIREDNQSMNTSSPAPVTLDCEKIVHEIEKNPQDFAAMAVESAKDPVHLEALIRKIINFLIQGLVSFLVEQGKDITKALQKLAKELEKALIKSGEGDAIAKLKEKLPQMFEEATDELRIQMMVKTRKDNPDDLKAVQKMAAKLFKEKDVRKRLGPALRNDLIQTGMTNDQFEQLFEKIEDAEAKKKSKVTISADELEELRKKAKAYDNGFVGEVVQEKVKKLEREKKMILDEKERVDSVIRNLAEGLLVVDKNGKVVLMNPAAEKLLGVKQTEKLGKTVMDGLKDEHFVAMTKGNLKDTEDQVAKSVEIVSLNDETRKVLQASTAVIENEDGQTVGMVSVLSDITRQKEVEDLKSQFVSHVSHELRTPLVAIQKSLALILGKEVGDINDEQQKFLAIAHRNIERLSRLINDVLDVSKLEAGKMNLTPKPIPVRELVHHVTSTVETWAKDKHIEFQYDFPEDGLFFEGDPDRLTQVITNLVGNAIKFTPEKGCIKIGAVSVKDREIQDQDCVEIYVQDSGIGIAPEDQKKIFNKFVQVSLAQPAGVSSTGLGLTIVKEIIELHSGKIWVESELEKGSRFIIRLPKKFHFHEETKSRF